MRRALLAALLLSGCGYSVDEVKDEKVMLTETVPASWDKVGACLAAKYAGEFQTTYAPVPSEQRAQLITKLVGPGIIQYQSIMFIIDVKGTGPSTVTYRRRPMSVGGDQRIRETIIECGKA